MKGLFSREFNTVVMDASDENVVRNISEAIDIVTKERHGSSTIKPFDEKRPSMMVIVTRTTKRTYKTIQNMVERAYPGLCVFSVKM